MTKRKRGKGQTTIYKTYTYNAGMDREILTTSGTFVVICDTDIP